MIWHYSVCLISEEGFKNKYTATGTVGRSHKSKSTTWWGVADVFLYTTFLSAPSTCPSYENQQRVGQKHGLWLLLPVELS